MKSIDICRGASFRFFGVISLFGKLFSNDKNSSFFFVFLLSNVFFSLVFFVGFRDAQI